MKNQLTLLVGLVLLVVLLAYMFLYQVPYDEVAVVTTFGRAQAPEQFNHDTGQWDEPNSVIQEAGLNFRLPAPIQSVHRYPRQQQVLEMQLEEVLTEDDFSVTVQAYMVWQIVDPYTFFQNAETIENAQRQLRAVMRGAVNSTITEYRFDQLVNAAPDRLQLADAEADALDRMRQRLGDDDGTDYGVEILHIGLHRLKLPESTSERVFERMRETRERLAETARREGRAEADSIRSHAEMARSNILAFTERRANEIRDAGRMEAAQYYRVFQQDEDFALFLAQLEALRQIVGNNTTFVLDADNLDVLRWLRDDADMMPRPVQEVEAASDQPDASPDADVTLP